MKVKRLELSGFKSFSEKTVITLGEGINAIVGPNGCGKSNILDALRWVMGEQSPKQLRGRSMEDVISCGVSDRKSPGLAEVTLVLENDGQSCPPEYAAYSEVEITRRLFRSGESEYRINKAITRLKDIISLFMDTGVGAKAYSVIEQGQIGAIIESRPADRRAIVEGAAGITKYKVRKHEAELKLDQARQNLVRVEDVLSEVRKQAASLKKQAQKAERYRGLRKDRTGLEMALAGKRRMNLAEQLGQAEAELAIIRDADLELRSKITAAGARLEQQRLLAAERAEELKDKTDDLGAKKGRIRESENEVKFAVRESERLAKQLVQAQEEVAGLTVKMDQADELIVLSQQKIDRFQLDIRDLEEDLAREDAALETSRSQINELDEMVQVRKSDLIDLMTRQSSLKNELTNAGKRVNELQWRQKTGDTDRRELAERICQTEEELAGAREGLMQSAEEISVLDRQMEEDRSRLVALRQDRNQAQARRNALDVEFSQVSSKLQVLNDLSNKFEWYQTGVKAVMQARADGRLEAENILGLVAENIEVAPQYEKAVSAVLGETLQSVIVTDQNAGVSAIEYLKRQASGRSVFIPLADMRKPDPAAIDQVPSHPEVGLPLAQQVSLKNGFHNLVGHLFHGVKVVENLTQGLVAWRQHGQTQTIVTLEGDIISAAGILSGGRGELPSDKLLAKKREMQDLTVRLIDLDRDKKQVANQAEELEKLVQDGDQLLRERELTRRELEQKKAEAEKQVLIKEKEIRFARERLEVIELEGVRFSEEIAELETKIEGLEGKLAQSHEEHQLINEELYQLSGDLHEHRAEFDRVKEQLMQRRLRQSAMQAELKGLVRDLDRTRSDKKELARRLDRALSQAQDGQEEMNRLAARKQEVDTSLNLLYGEVEELTEETASLREAFGSLREELAKEEQVFKDMEGEHRKKEEQLQSYHLQVSELKLKLDHLDQLVNEKYGSSVNQTPPDQTDAWASLSEVEIKARIEDLITQLEGIGQVNLMAITEYEAVQERLDFVTAQREDLMTSMEDLAAAIKKINKTTKERFLAMLDEINKKMQVVFPAMFNGGRAELKLTDENDPLGAGVEIIAQPPGKRISTLRLLSGGEKALTALSLLFSIHLIKPSPFCLFDEIDSPLDDANVDRFNKLLKSISKSSQIILITHNKKNMEVADQLHGVTMEKPGISKMVSVRLRDLDERMAKPAGPGL
ncbi:MAG: chromosome segregation protein SMC [Deltaproteobacteria bacterium]|nr:chromosome segregation protein SMC [Deltaproteobacteria bacterium]